MVSTLAVWPPKVIVAVFSFVATAWASTSMRSGAGAREERATVRDHSHEREVAVRYRPGTALIYRHDLWVSTGAN